VAGRQRGETLPSRPRRREGGSSRPGEAKEAPAKEDFLDAEGFARRKKAARDQAIAWLRRNNRWGPDADIVSQTATPLDGWLSRGDGLQVNLGGKLLKSGRPMILAARAEDVFRFEVLTPLGLPLRWNPMARGLRAYSGGEEARRRAPRVVLSSLRFDSLVLPRGDPVSGRVEYRRTGPPGETPHLRLVYYPGQVRTTAMHYLRPAPEADKGVIHFAFAPLNPRYVRDDEPLVVFLEWGSRHEGKDVIESNTLAELLWPVGKGE
jgi:hypothetical protein